MAFKDITKVLYDGKIKLDYKDKAHRYYARPRVNWDLPEDDPKAWGKIMYPKGTTTLIGDTLEKKGLMTWALGLGLRELAGFYDFEGDNGRMTGFSKGVGELWDGDKTKSLTKEELLPIMISASKAWQRKQAKGADIGTVVHDAIEHYVRAHPNNPDKEPELNTFDIAEQYMWNIKEAFPMPDTDKEDDPFAAERALAMEEFQADVECATLAYNRFVQWWEEVKPCLYGAEDLLYSLDHNVCGTYDADLGIPIEHHPMPELFKGKKLIRCTTDWKTSNASKSKSAAMPEGINYQYFVQDAIYEMVRREMGYPPADDLLVVSARKDGGFSLVFASELGMTVDECIKWAESVIMAYRMAEKSKAGLLKHAEPQISNKEAF